MIWRSSTTCKDCMSAFLVAYRSGDCHPCVNTTYPSVVLEEWYGMITSMKTPLPSVFYENVVVWRLFPLRERSIPSRIEAWRFSRLCEHLVAFWVPWEHWDMEIVILVSTPSCLLCSMGTRGRWDCHPEWMHSSLLCSLGESRHRGCHSYLNISEPSIFFERIEA